MERMNERQMENKKMKKKSTRKQIFITFIYTLCVCFGFFLSSLIRIRIKCRFGIHVEKSYIIRYTHRVNSKQQQQEKIALNRKWNEMVEIRILRKSPNNKFKHEQNNKPNTDMRIKCYFHRSNDRTNKFNSINIEAFTATEYNIRKQKERKNGATKSECRHFNKRIISLITFDLPN